MFAGSNIPFVSINIYLNEIFPIKAIHSILGITQETHERERVPAMAKI